METTTEVSINQLSYGRICRNGLVIKCNLVSTEKNPMAGLVEIVDVNNKVNTTRRFMCSKHENAVKIARILCEDFDL